MARLASRSARKTIREELGISEEKKILLLGFGGHDTRWNLRDSFMPTKVWDSNTDVQYIYTYIHTYMYTYIHICIHTYILQTSIHWDLLIYADLRYINISYIYTYSMYIL